MSKDLEHLGLLVTFHYIVAAITAIFFSFPMIHVILGLMLLLNPQGFQSRGQQFVSDRLIGLLFLMIGSAVVLFGWTLAALTAYAGHCIRRRQRHTFCLVVACLNCLHQPVGIALGVFTLIVLSRNSVKLLFVFSGPPAPPSAGTVSNQFSQQ